MPEPGSIATIRAAVEVIVPGDDRIPSGVDLGVDRHVVDLAEQYLTGFADVIAALLDAYAAEHGGPFAELDPAGRVATLRTMAADESTDIRDAADALFVFSYGGMYSEWTGFDPERRVLRAPAAWAALGFHGPVLGHPDFRDVPAGPSPDVRDVEP